MSVIDEYLKKFEMPKRKELERIRSIAKKIVPDAEESIGYDMPTLRYKGHSFLGFTIHKEHLGIYPYGGEVIEALKNQLKEYGLSKGTIRVPFDHPISENMLKKIIIYRIKQIEKKTKK